MKNKEKNIGSVSDALTEIRRQNPGVFIPSGAELAAKLSRKTTTEGIIAKLRHISGEVGSFEACDSDTEDCLDKATGAIQTAIDALKGI